MKNYFIQKEISRILLAEAHALLECVDRIQSKGGGASWVKVLNLFQNTLKKGGKIIWVGVGKSGKIAQKIAATFCSTGSMAISLHPTEAFHGDLGMIAPQDCLVAMSATGNTKELIELIEYLKKRPQCPTLIGLGGNAQSRLAQWVEVWLDAFVEKEACPYDLAPTSSTTLALAMGDALALTLMQLRGFRPEHFATNHPGGVLGRRLSLKVQDCMISGDALLPLVSPESSLEGAIHLCSEKKLGVVLVHRQKKLLGILTDGDIRRLLDHQAHASLQVLLQKPIREVMISSPLTISPERMAQQALDLMENRKSQINVLPVVNQKKMILGLVRIHDLVQIL